MLIVVYAVASAKTGFPSTCQVRESHRINLVKESWGILLMVREKWCVSSKLRNCCLFLLKLN